MTYWGRALQSLPSSFLVKYAFWSYIGTLNYQPRFKENGDCGLTASRKHQPWPYHALFSNIIKPTLRFMVFRISSNVSVCAALYIVSYQDSTPLDQNLLADLELHQRKWASRPSWTLMLMIIRYIIPTSIQRLCTHAYLIMSRWPITGTIKMEW